MAKKKFEGEKAPTVSAEQTQPETVETVETVASDVAQEAATQETLQAVKNEQHFANNTDEAIEPQENKMAQQTATEQKSGGKALALLALLVALGIGGAGYFFGNQELAKIKTEVQTLTSKAGQTSNQVAAEMPTFEAEKAQLADLGRGYQQALDKITQLERQQSAYTQQISQLQRQLQAVSNVPNDNSQWLLSDANFLLNSALRKLVLDGDFTTTKNLLLEADSVLSKVSSSDALAVREAIKSDLNHIAAINEVDQNGLMVRLTQLANSVDDMPMLNTNNSNESDLASGEVSDSVNDWEKNIEKSASSFLDHFIRISSKNNADQKEFIAPNQEVYLRENIRLRLQLAILAIPRQQEELYKQSLDAVSTWVRSYFDEQNDSVKNFLKEVDNLAGVSIYIDAPKQLQSLTLLDKVLNKSSQKVEEVKIEAEKSLEPVQPTSGKQPANAQ